MYLRDITRNTPKLIHLVDVFRNLPIRRCTAYLEFISLIPILSWGWFSIVTVCIRHFLGSYLPDADCTDFPYNVAVPKRKRG